MVFAGTGGLSCRQGSKQQAGLQAATVMASAQVCTKSDAYYAYLKYDTTASAPQPHVSPTKPVMYCNTCNDLRSGCATLTGTVTHRVDPLGPPPPLSRRHRPGLPGRVSTTVRPLLVSARHLAPGGGRRLLRAHDQAGLRRHRASLGQQPRCVGRTGVRTRRVGREGRGPLLQR